VTPTRQENGTTAVDREVSSRPPPHRSLAYTGSRSPPGATQPPNSSVEHRNIKHGNDQYVKDRLAAEQAQFKDTREVGSTQLSAGTAAGVAREHVHHHVHENIQPVVQKEKIQTSVIILPSQSRSTPDEAKYPHCFCSPCCLYDEFKRQGGSLGVAKSAPMPLGASHGPLEALLVALALPKEQLL